MANNPRFSGAQPHQPPIVGSMEPPRTFLPPMSSQFRQVGPAQQSQQFNPVPSQHFYPVGRGVPLMNVGLPPQSLQPQFSQPMQQFPPRAGQPGHATLPSQAIPLPIAQPNMHIISENLMPQINAQTPNNYSPGLGGPERPLSSSYTFASSSYGQPQMNFNTSTHYQSTSQMHAPNISSGRQLSLSSESQSTASAAQHIAEQPSVPAAIASAASIQHNSTREAPTDWIEHTSADGRRYYYNKKTRLSSWEKPSELMTPLERADASTNWKEFTSPDGRKYYYNKVSKESKWSIPEELKLAREQVEKSSFLGTQQETFGNPPVSYTVPPSVVEAPSGADTLSSPAQGIPSSPVSAGPDVAVSPVLVSGSPASTVIASTKDEKADGVQTLVNVVTSLASVPESVEASVSIASTIPASMDDVDNLSAQDIHSSADGIPAKVLEGVDAVKALEEVKTDEIGEKMTDSALVAKSIDPEPLIYANKLEAKNAFKALLESTNVGSDWTWDRAMRVIINDRRYGALKTLGERKQAFTEFLSQRKKQEAEERRSKLKNAREEFKQMLEECTDLTSSTRWSKAVSVFENDERFKAVERDRDRRELFDNYLVELKNKERARADEERKRNIMEYRQFLESCDFIKADSQWRKLQDRLEADERCARLEKIDRLDVFLEHIRDLEKEEEERRKIHKEELRKVERKNRDEFRKLMEEHVTAGILTAKTHWRDYCVKIKDLPAYLAVASNTSGSTAKELFEDVLEELEKQYHEDKTRIKDAVKLGKILLSSTWTLEDFKGSVLKDFNSPPVSDVNLKLVFDELLERVREKEEKEAKKRKRLADDFVHLLCSMKEITASSKWEDCKPQFEGSREFSSIGEESLCSEIFEQYIAQLKEQEKEHEQKRKEEKAKKEKERRKVKQRRENEEGREREKDEQFKKDLADSKYADETELHAWKENKRSGEDNIKKQRKRHQSSEDIVDGNEKDRSRKSHGSTSDHKKSRRHASAPESDNESKHKRHKRDRRNGSRRYGEHGELEDGEFGC
ncbi:pre-mRNA-processing protein 40A-like isoform X2 [Alnus glutinosa]|uniref:pre-mRNA-processing protein 40A-like isoform X2 n=1 Tax=Alnus glutinosa TaxID=3517 RepID=UPI002D7A115E|nr:pre-mRNA-processing protein 40A-like isoform X2 [Alnus glutinosa]